MPKGGFAVSGGCEASRKPSQQLLFQGGLSPSQCYPTLPKCPHQKQSQCRSFFKAQLWGEQRAELKLYEREAFCLPLPMPRGSSGTEEDQVPFLALSLSLAVPDFPMSATERQFTFVAQCFELLGLKVE